MRYLAILVLLTAACGGTGDAGTCILTAETQPDGSVLFIDPASGSQAVTCDGAFSSCVQSNGLPVDPAMMRECRDANAKAP